MPQATLLIKPVSNTCNMRCRYCFYADVSKHREIASFGMMNRQTCDALVRKALNYADDYCSFGFQGGEPTLAGLDFYKNIVKLQHEYNHNNVKIYNSIQTNGYKIDKEWAEFFAENNFLAGLSLDGIKETHEPYRPAADGLGTYEHVLETAELFTESGVDFNIICVVNNDVASHPKEIYSALKKYKYLQFIPCLDDFGEQGQKYSPDVANYASFLKNTFDEYYYDYIHGDYVSIRNFDNYLSILLGNPPEQCGMSGVCTCYFLVEADGSVYPCDFYVLDEWRIGNVNEHSFTRMAKSPPAKEFINISRQVNADCRVCEWRGLCRGGCRRYREPYAGGILPKNALCEAYIGFFEYAYDKMQEIVTNIRSR